MSWAAGRVAERERAQHEGRRLGALWRFVIAAEQRDEPDPPPRKLL